jgi:hypothetical protein
MRPGSSWWISTFTERYDRGELQVDGLLGTLLVSGAA